MDELARGKELEVDQNECEDLKENTFDTETTKEDQAQATLALDEEAAGQTKRNSGSVLLGLGSLHYPCIEKTIGLSAVFGGKPD